MSYNGLKYRFSMLGYSGMDLRTNLADREPQVLKDGKNISLHDSCLQRDFGESAINAVAFGSADVIIRTGFDYYPDEESQRAVIYTGAGRIYKVPGVGDADPSLWNEVASGLSGTKVGMFVEAGNEIPGNDKKLIFFNGFDYPRVITSDGSTTERIGLMDELTDPLDTTMGDATLTVHFTGHGLSDGNYVSLVGFTITSESADNINPASAVVTVIDPDTFTVEMASGALDNNSSKGNTGKIYTHPGEWVGTTQPEGATLHQTNLIAWMGHYIYVSDFEWHEDFEINSNIIPVFSAYGNKIMCCKSLYGRVIVFKYPHGIFEVVNPDSYVDYNANTISSRIGLASKHAVAQVGAELCFLSSQGGIHFLSAVQEAGDIHESSITDMLNLGEFFKSKVEMTRLNQAVMDYDETYHTILCALPAKGDTENSFMIKIDITNRSIPKVTYSEKKGTYIGMWTQLAANKEKQVVVGTSDGVIRRLNYTNRSVDGEAFSSIAETDLTDMTDQFQELGDVKKRAEFLEISVTPDQGNARLSCDVIVDGSVADTLIFNITSEEISFPITFPVTFPIVGLKKLRKRIQGAYGKRYGLRFLSSDVGSNFKISDVIINFRIGTN